MKQAINIPESLSEITLKKYLEFSKVANNENNSKDFIIQKMVSIFCDIPLANIGRIKVTSLMEIVDHINKLFEQKNELKKTFRFNTQGKFKDLEFGFIPDLENMILDEYADLDSYINDIETMHKAMAVLYRPITKKIGDSYLIEDYQGSNTYSDAMLYAPLDVVLGARVFFWNLGSALLNDTTLSLIEEMEAEISQSKLSSEILGDGFKAFTDSLKETLHDLKPLENYLYINV